MPTRTRGPGRPSASSYVGRTTVQAALTAPRRDRTRRAPMGLFRIAVEVARAGRRVRWVEILDMLVDSGSEVTWVPEGILRELGIAVFKPGEVFLMADGRRIVRDVGVALIRHGQFK